MRITTIHDVFSSVGIYAYSLERHPSENYDDVGRRRKEFDDAFLTDPLPPHHSEIVSFSFPEREGEVDILGRFDMRSNNGEIAPVNLLGLAHFFVANEKTNPNSSWHALVCTFVRSRTTGKMWQFLLNGPYLSASEYSGGIQVNTERTLLIPVVHL
jgi:hypothetical protein